MIATSEKIRNNITRNVLLKIIKNLLKYQREKTGFTVF